MRRAGRGACGARSTPPGASRLPPFSEGGVLCAVRARRGGAAGATGRCDCSRTRGVRPGPLREGAGERSEPGGVLRAGRGGTRIRVPEKPARESENPSSRETENPVPDSRLPGISGSRSDFPRAVAPSAESRGRVRETGAKGASRKVRNVRKGETATSTPWTSRTPRVIHPRPLAMLGSLRRRAPRGSLRIPSHRSRSACFRSACQSALPEAQRRKPRKLYRASGGRPNQREDPQVPAELRPQPPRWTRNSPTAVEDHSHTLPCMS